MGDSSDSNHNLDDSGAVGLAGKIMVVGIIVLFMVVVFVLFIHLYAKWFWWRRRTGNPAAVISGDSRRRGFVFTPGQEGTAAMTALPSGLDPSILCSIPVLIIDPAVKGFKVGSECAVCLSELSQGEKARVLPKCNHGFHVECIDMWFHSHSTCPLCRNPISLHNKDSSPHPPPAHELPSQTSPSQARDHQNLVVGVYSTESPNFPTNILFWGNQSQVTSGSSPEVPSPPPPGSAHSSPSSSGNIGGGADGMLVIDIPETSISSSVSVSSPSVMRCYSEEEAPRSPMTTRLRSLKRLLSRDRRSNTPSSPPSCSAMNDEVRAQMCSSKVASDG